MPPKAKILPVEEDDPPPRQSLEWIRKIILLLTPESKASIPPPSSGSKEDMTSLQVRVLNLSRRMGIPLRTWRDKKGNLNLRLK